MTRVCSRSLAFTQVTTVSGFTVTVGGAVSGRRVTVVTWTGSNAERAAPISHGAGNACGTGYGMGVTKRPGPAADSERNDINRRVDIGTSARYHGTAGWARNDIKRPVDIWRADTCPEPAAGRR